MIIDSRFIIVGDCVVAKALENVLSLILPETPVTRARSDESSADFVRKAAMSPRRRDSTHLISVTPLSTCLSPNRMFELHCTYRRKTLGGVSWEGALIFVGRQEATGTELTQLQPFSKIGAGHHVLITPISLITLLETMNDAGAVYGEKWIQELTAIGGLADLRKALEAAERADVELEVRVAGLKQAINQILEDDLLSKLLAHRDVISRLRSLRNSVERIRSVSLQQVHKLTTEIRDVMARYL